MFEHYYVKFIIMKKKKTSLSMPFLEFMQVRWQVVPLILYANTYNGLFCLFVLIVTYMDDKTFRSPWEVETKHN